MKSNVLYLDWKHTQVSSCHQWIMWELCTLITGDLRYFVKNLVKVIELGIRTRTLNSEYDETGSGLKHGDGVEHHKCKEELEANQTEIQPILMIPIPDWVLDSPPKRRSRKRGALANNKNRSKTQSALTFHWIVKANSGKWQPHDDMLSIIANDSFTGLSHEVLDAVSVQQQLESTAASHTVIEIPWQWCEIG